MCCIYAVYIFMGVGLFGRFHLNHQFGATWWSLVYVVLQFPKIHQRSLKWCHWSVRFVFGRVLHKFPQNSGRDDVYQTPIPHRRPSMDVTVHHLLINRAIYRFWPLLSTMKNHLKIQASGSGSSPKSNHFVLVTHPTCPPNFIRIHWDILFTDRQTYRHRWKHHLCPLSVVEVTTKSNQDIADPHQDWFCVANKWKDVF